MTCLEMQKRDNTNVTYTEKEHIHTRERETQRLVWPSCSWNLLSRTAELSLSWSSHLEMETGVDISAFTDIHTVINNTSWVILHHQCCSLMCDDPGMNLGMNLQLLYSYFTSGLSLFKGIIHPKMEILIPFCHPHVGPSPYDFLSQRG